MSMPRLRDQVSKLELVTRQQDILEMFCKRRPSRALVYDWCKPEGSDALQHWVVDNLRKQFSYATGIEIIESAVRISVSQIENGGEEVM